MFREPTEPVRGKILQGPGNRCPCEALVPGVIKGGMTSGSDNLNSMILVFSRVFAGRTKGICVMRGEVPMWSIYKRSIIVSPSPVARSLGSSW
ncbi:hypothetical protein BDZ89DRAFT_1067274 [Hymenopellis radicata]|nr:hypothetical protein BDZ89DRAFT_1067274 [Hymenopellis radicata]